MKNTPEQEILRNQIIKFCSERIWPHCEEDDEKHFFRKDIFQGLGELGLTATVGPEDFGGLGLEYKDFCFILKELAKFSPAYAVTLSVSVMVQCVIAEYGTQKQKEKYLPALISGEGIGGFALTESRAGSDAAAMHTKFSKTEDGYLLQGNKYFITSGSVAKTFVVMAKLKVEDDTEKAIISAFIVDASSKGLKIVKIEKKMGLRASPTTELIFENVFVPKENLLGDEGQGFKIALHALDKGRIGIGAISIGLAKKAFLMAKEYALGREQFGKSIYDFQGIQFLFAEMFTEIISAEILVDEAARSYDAGEKVSLLAAMAKLKASNVAMRACVDAVQVFGGVGYTTEFHIERFMRDAKVMQIVEGTSQIQKIVIAREMKDLS